MMKLKTLVFCGISMISTSIWADYSGHYACEGTHRDKPIKFVIDLNAKDNSYHEKLNIFDKIYEYDLLPTKDSAIFLLDWKTEDSLGISAWNFKDSNFNIEQVFFDFANGKKFNETFNCTKVN